MRLGPPPAERRKVVPLERVPGAFLARMQTVAQGPLRCPVGDALIPNIGNQGRAKATNKNE
jgi:hypothetical protein